jgi:hypothetical protein
MSERSEVRVGALAWASGSALLIAAAGFVTPLRVGSVDGVDPGNLSGAERAAAAEFVTLGGALLILAGFAKLEVALRTSTRALAAHLAYAMGMTLVLVLVVEAAFALGAVPWLIRAAESGDVDTADTGQLIDAARLGAVLVVAALGALVAAFTVVAVWFDPALRAWLVIPGAGVAIFLGAAALRGALEPAADPLAGELGAALLGGLVWIAALYGAVLALAEPERSDERQNPG